MNSFKIAYSSLRYYRKYNALYCLLLSCALILFSGILTLIEVQQFNMKQINQRLQLADQDKGLQTVTLLQQIDQQLTANYQLIVTLILLVVVTIFTILTSVFFYHRRYELATLLNIGVKKLTILGQFLIEYCVTLSICLLAISTLFFLTHTPVKNKLVHINQVAFSKQLPNELTLPTSPENPSISELTEEDDNYLLPFNAASFSAIDTENTVCTLFSPKLAIAKATSLVILSSLIPLIICGYLSLIIIKNTN